ncbi:glycosyltransferase [Bacillus sp. OVS6]|nr:glycosyltransferase [Bacillus sp. OVS6]
MPAISIVVPIYNVEKYLHKCIDSILSQNFTDLEIVLVNDGSTDSCGRICDEYSIKDNRVKVIHKKNGGLSDARNTGIEISTGDFIGFVDSDDWVEPNMYETLYNLCISNSADISTCSIFVWDIDNRKKQKNIVILLEFLIVRLLFNTCMMESYLDFQLGTNYIKEAFLKI